MPRTSDNVVTSIKSGGWPADKKFMHERRSEVRMLCADVVELSWKDPAGGNRRTMALLEDISTSGACLQLESSIPLAAEVRWRSPNQEFTGQVRYCVYREIGYFVGVEFQPASRWTKKAYKPQHLLDLKRLMVNTKR